MKFCPYCGKEMDKDMMFCPFCGKAFPSTTSVDVSAQPQTATLRKKTVSPKKFFLPLIAALAVILAVILLINPFGGGFSEDPDAIEKASASVVKLTMYDVNNIALSSGSGFAALDKDIIVTNHHCIEGDVYFIEAQRNDGSVFPIDSVIAYDEEKDIAVLRAPGCNLSPLKTGIGLETKQGEKVAAIGSPEGIASMYSTGVLSKIEDLGTHKVLLSTASISHGSSGGALFNDWGQVIGITSAGHVSGNEIYFSVPIEYAKELYDNSTPEEELTIAEFYDQSVHPYSVDYITSHGNVLHTQSVVVYGYISGMDSNLYLVSTPDLIVGIDLRNNFDLTSSLLLTELRNQTYALQVDTSKVRELTKDLLPGDLILVEGTIRYFSSNDIRLIANDLLK